MIRFHVVTIFPEAVRPYMDASILGRAQESKHIAVSYYDPRELAGNKWGKVDDRPYAGGPGMVMTAEPLLRTLEKIAKSIAKKKNSKIKVMHFAPSGKQFTNEYAKGLVKKYTDIILIAGRYEGIDARVHKIFKGDIVSVGPFVLTGGEVPAMVVVDACARQIEGVLGKLESLEEERTASPEMYTRPEVLEWKGKKYRVPKVLLGGDHKKIEEWRAKAQGKGGK
ncbi:tRNA (guanosine(37)-N1)-methyltransferase TrmD [Candidatus Nomurabacteria bacterium CG1_02_43_90]|uniref:tRNA (guanine-N(1)-)-methyltransferase n=1 Tax=Candidatus Nomurabacteria bacterium CG1_02_43_90 TaxID=1805281 RepID=A0A1J4V1L5_9BACT|nr:MAG: tRNA (guanosine(37)-N1)-methyltransferase TrmD [Candidatus Nomurabacteria bacterium CG1_02_43_90]